MTQHNIADAKAHFSELIQKTLLGEEVIIAKGNRPIAKIVPLASDEELRIPGSGKDQIRYIADDFDATPEDFMDYQ